MREDGIKTWTWSKNYFFDKYVKSYLKSISMPDDDLLNELSNEISKFDVIIVEYSEETGTFRLYGDSRIASIASKEKLDIFFDDDNGFGSYLYKTMYNEKEDEVTMATTYSSNRTLNFSLDDSLGINNFGYVSSNTTDSSSYTTGTISTINTSNMVTKDRFDEALDRYSFEIAELQKKWVEMEEK